MFHNFFALLHLVFLVFTTFYSKLTGNLRESVPQWFEFSLNGAIGSALGKTCTDFHLEGKNMSEINL